MLQSKSLPYRFILFAIVFLTVDFIIENVNHDTAYNDFKVYYYAANALVSHNQVYGVFFALGSGNYKYSPFTALLFYPATLLSYRAASVINILCTSFSIIIAFVILAGIFTKYYKGRATKSSDLILFLSLLCSIVHFVRELQMGNINALLLMLLLLSIYLVLDKKQIPAGIVLAVVLITKPFFVLMLIPLLMHKYYKTIVTSGIALAFFVAAPAIFVGFNNDIVLHTQWLDTMLAHAEGFASPYTIESILKTFFSQNIPSNFQYVILAALLGLYIFFIRNNNKKQTAVANGEFSFCIECFILLAMLPSLFSTDSEHFLMTMPLIMWFIVYLFSGKNVPLTIAFVVFVILYDGNSSDILGHQLSTKIRELGVLGMGNLGLIILAPITYYKFRYQEKA